MKVVIETSVNESRWDRLVAGASGGHIFQSATWAAFEREYLGVQNYFFTMEDSDSGEPLALLRARRESPFHRLLFEKLLNSLTVPLADRLCAELRVEWGPVYLGSPEQKERAEMLNLFLDETEKFCRGRGIISLRGVFGSIYETDREDDNDTGIKEIFGSRGYRTAQEATFLVDLRLDEDTLWRNLKQSARKAIRHGLDQGIKVERIKYDSELAPYHDFVCRCRRSLGLKSTSLRNFTEMWRILRPAGMLEIFYASQDNELLGGLGVWQHSGVVIEWGSVQSERARIEKIYCSDLLKWEVIRWGHSQGYRLYDLAGVEPNLAQADPKKKGIYQFKAKWGGRYKQSDVFFKPLKPLRYSMLKLGTNLAKKLVG